MASTIKAGNATDGVQISSDNTGALDIKTGTGAGTTALSIDASQNVAIPGTLTIAGQPAGGNYALNQYTAPATWTKPAGLKAIKVTVVGAGGNGGSGAPLVTSGGGGGGTAIYYAPAPSIPGPQSITAGSGTNSFGAIASATAGSAGGITGAAGGAGGAGTGGSVNVNGGSGSTGLAIPNSPLFYGFGGAGGSSLLGLGGGGVAANPSFTLTNGNNATGYGGGGGGGARIPSGPSPTASGGSGTPGIVIVEEFY